jgi:pyruvate/2-oxoacid:ferredoxin oxidoreductase alpha subunit
MGVTKKPAVAAKTVAKKRGRPVGSKNKTQAWPFPTDKDVDLAKLLDKTQEALAIEMKTVQALEGLFEDFKSKVIIAEKMSLFGRIKFVFTGKL